MSDSRWKPEDLGELAALPPDDPRRRAVEATARGRAMLLAYREFVAPADTPAGARPSEADAILATALAREIGEPVRSGGDRTLRSVEESVWTRLIRSLSAPAMRPAYALAALLIVSGGLWTMWKSSGRAPATHLRGEAAHAAIALSPPQTLAAGAIELGWQPVAGATSYEVAFFAPDLTELGHTGPLAEPRLVLEPGALPAGLHPGADVLWQVTARSGADAIGQSRTTLIRLP